MKAISTFLLAMFAMAAFAQTEITTIPVKMDSMCVEYSPVTGTIIPGGVFAIPTMPASLLPARSHLNRRFHRHYEHTTFQIPSLSLTPGQSNLYRWSNGSITATGAEKDMPGLMHINSGAIGVFQNHENMSLYLGVEANKYGFYRGLRTQYGITGNLSYYLSPHISFTAYGAYYFGTPPAINGGMPMTPAILGYFQWSTFGGYMNYRINDRSGVLVGGQAVQQAGTNKYQFEPIVTPYFKIGKVSIGLPVGQIFNGFIREQSERRRYNRHYQVSPSRR